VQYNITQQSATLPAVARTQISLQTIEHFKLLTTTDGDASRFRKFEGENPKTKAKWSIDVGYERFLGRW
jgi:hypothetical protein